MHSYGVCLFVDFFIKTQITIQKRMYLPVRDGYVARTTPFDPIAR